MKIEIKPIETEKEIKEKAYVYWRCWHNTYKGLVSDEYLNSLNLQKCEERAFESKDNIIIAKDEDRVVGFAEFGIGKEEGCVYGEILTLYVLPEYCGQGIGTRLMKSVSEHLSAYPQICLWVLKENKRAIRFYEKFGFYPDGKEKMSTKVGAEGIRMIKRKKK